MLSFFGRGSGFSDEHNSAFFYYNRNIILMDCSIMAFLKMKNAGLRAVSNSRPVDRITIAVTHTHSDHVAGIPMLVHYCYFVWHIKVCIIAPSEDVRGNLMYYLTELEGCNESAFNILTSEEYRESEDEISAAWLKNVIPTEHVPELHGKCFGYNLNIEGKNVIYTGDTCTLEPFKPYIEKGSILYTECSAYDTKVHLYVKKLLEEEEWFKEKRVSVYLMHLDNEDKISEETNGTIFRFAPIACLMGVSMSDTKCLLGNIYDISSKLYAEMCSDKEKDHGALFEYMTELGRTMADADRASFWKWDRQKKQLWTTSATGVDRIVIPDNTGLVGKALKLGKVIVTNNPYNDPDFNKEVDIKTGYVTKSVLVMPVADINGQFIGAFQIINKNGDTGFDEKEDVRKLSMAALICGLAVESEMFFEESHHDKLTKLKNRMGFYSDFSRRYNEVLTTGRPLSMFISDIDKFKRVNDTYGHNAGDDVLAFVANLLDTFCKNGEAVYRWGGEEFIMMMPDTTMEESAKRAEEIRKKIMDSTIEADGNTLNVTMSFGCNQFSQTLSIEDNISIADEKLYTAKETGRNRVIS